MPLCFFIAQLGEVTKGIPRKWRVTPKRICQKKIKRSSEKLILHLKRYCFRVYIGKWHYKGEVNIWIIYISDITM
jgi:hypothetical protein